jgi:DNA-binding transcriptional MerR regulator
LSSAALAYPIKSPEAFRTISEAATDLDVPQHVLRFWESRFSQIKPVKRAGGRRFYRPEDIDLLKGIRALLYVDGLTIRGVQKILKERGVRHVAAIGRDGAPAPAPQVVEKIVFVEKPAAPVRKRPTHLRAVPSPAPMTLPLFADEPPVAAVPQSQSIPPADVAVDPGLAREEHARLEALLAELMGLKARFARLRA